jgi:hypothetical protein
MELDETPNPGRGGVTALEAETERAERLSAALRRTAAVLEQSAALAEEHARRRERLDRGDADAERRVVTWARARAERARSYADDVLQRVER